MDFAEELLKVKFKVSLAAPKGHRKKDPTVDDSRAHPGQTDVGLSIYSCHPRGQEPLAKL